jgi:phosphoribosylformylglycinamidine (FGAM) synthase PurS component
MGPGDENKSTGKGLLDAIGSNFNLNDIASIVLKLDDAASAMLKQFGQGQAMSDVLRRTMAESVTDVRRLGGDIEDVLRTQQEASESLGRNIILSAQASKDLYATMRVTGQDVSKIVGGMADVGISSFNATTEMKKVVDVARESGVNAQAVSSKVLDNMQALNKYNFAGGVEGLAKMAAQATALRIDMGQTLAFAEKVFDPEGAIEVAAAMQRLGVSQSELLDPLKLMDLSQNDPAELQNQIAQMSKQFVQLGKDGHFEIMPGAKRQLREISQAMGISYDQLTKMALGGADLDKKLKEIKFPESIATESQKKLIANMAEMGDGGEYKIKVENPETGEIVTKALKDLNEKDVTNLEKMANTAPKTMEQLAKEQLSTSVTMAADIKTLADRTGLGFAASATSGKALDLAKATTGSLSALPSENLSVSNIAKGIDATTGKVSNLLHDYSNNLITNGEAISQATGLLKSFGNFMSDEFTSSFKNLQKEADKLDKQFPIFGDALGSFKRAGQEIGVLPPSTGQSPNSNNNNSSTPSSNAQSSNSEVTHTLNINVNSNNPNIDTKQVVDWFNNTDVKQKVITTVSEVYGNAIGSPIPKKK